jgi:hypothetical protein
VSRAFDSKHATTCGFESRASGSGLRAPGVGRRASGFGSGHTHRHHSLIHRMRIHSHTPNPKPLTRNPIPLTLNPKPGAPQDRCTANLSGRDGDGRPGPMLLGGNDESTALQVARCAEEKLELPAHVGIQLVHRPARALRVLETPQYAHGIHRHRPVDVLDAPTLVLCHLPRGGRGGGRRGWGRREGLHQWTASLLRDRLGISSPGVGCPCPVPSSEPGAGMYVCHGCVCARARERAHGVHVRA